VEVEKDVFHPVHEYNDTLKNIYMDDFKASPEYKLFQEKTGRKSISYSMFVRGAKMCKCIKEPTMRVCVDEIETVFAELTTTLANLNRSNTTVCLCPFCRLEDKKKKELGEGKHNSVFVIVYLHSKSNFSLYCSDRLYTPPFKWCDAAEAPLVRAHGFSFAHGVWKAAKGVSQGVLCWKCLPRMLCFPCKWIMSLELSIIVQ
jgi:hypothetical protein